MIYYIHLMRILVWVLHAEFVFQVIQANLKTERINVNSNNRKLKLLPKKGEGGGGVLGVEDTGLTGR